MTASEPRSDLEILTAVLRHFDWSPRSRTGSLYEIWAPTDDAEDEVLVPLDPAKADFSGLLDRARRAVLSQYGMVAGRLWDTLSLQTRALLDLTQWKKETPLNAGIIGWEQGEAQYSSARSQLIASAKSSKEARRYHGNASAHIAKRFIENSFMGQTDIGSFIITAYTPSSRRFYLTESAEKKNSMQPPMWDSAADSLSGREILGTFEQALRAVRQGLTDYKKTPRPELFLDMVPDGVSYEFARALSQMISGGDAAVEIRRQVVGERQQSSGEVAFDAVEAPVLDRVANLFVAESEPESVTLVGEVTLLSRSPGDPHRIIRLNVAHGADVRKARVRLTNEQYELAMEAHRLEAGLKLSGRLEKEGHQYWVYDADEVSVVPDPLDDFEEVGREGSSVTDSERGATQPNLFD